MLFEDLMPLDTCACCDEPVADVRTCYCCLLTICEGCAVPDAAGDVLCEDCARDMGAFLADGGHDQVEEVA